MNPLAYQALVLRGALALLSKGIKPNSLYSWKAVLAAAARLTGNGPYTRGSYEVARRDLKQFADNLAGVE